MFNTLQNTHVSSLGLNVFLFSIFSLKRFFFGCTWIVPGSDSSTSSGVCTHSPECDWCSSGTASCLHPWRNCISLRVKKRAAEISSSPSHFLKHRSESCERRRSSQSFTFYHLTLVTASNSTPVMFVQNIFYYYHMIQKQIITSEEVYIYNSSHRSFYSVIRSFFFRLNQLFSYDMYTIYRICVCM